MKKTILVIVILSLFGNTFAQKTKVYSSTGYLIKDNIVAPQGLSLKGDNPNDNFIIAYKKGYITQGEYIKEIIKKEEYTFNLTEIPTEIHLDKENLNIVNFSRFKYKSDNYYYIISESEAEKMMGNINQQMADLGFKVSIVKQTLFEEKLEKIDFTIGAEVITTQVKTLGTSGFNISTLVKWVVFDMNKKEVAFNKTAYGYSNSKKAKPYTDEYELALKDAINQLIYDEEFQKIVSSKVTREEENDIVETLKIDFNEKIPNTESEEDVLNYIKQATVTIKTEYGHGSGFFISTNGYILTNNHVIKDAQTIEIVLNSGLMIDAEVIRNDSKRDVALLKVIGKGFKSIPIYSGKATAGTEVYAVGTPADIDLGQTVTKGIISGNRVFEENTYIQTDVSISQGNSGGPLVNKEGKVMGIVSAKLVGDGIEGIGFGIPIIKALETLNIKN